MICPYCGSRELRGPDRPSEGRMDAPIQCSVCGRHFDAYQWYGAPAAVVATRAA